jgi:hypothetical protein
MAKIGAEIKGQPSKEQLDQLGALHKRNARVSATSTYALIAAVIFMALARYLVF